MRSSNKSRNRNKNNNNRRGAASNNINRVFESAGPEGRVRGTPQQIIDKYMSLAHDSQLAGDRVSAENFQQRAEHYSRLLLEAQKELADKQVDQQPSSQPLTDHTNVDVGDHPNPNQKNVAEKESFENSVDGTVLDFDKKLEKKITQTQENISDEKGNKRKNIKKNSRKELTQKLEEVNISNLD